MLDKRSIKLDNEGYVDMTTGVRYQQILKTDLEVSKPIDCITQLPQYGDVLGKGNGGMVRAGVHKVSGIPVAIKVSSSLSFSYSYSPQR